MTHSNEQITCNRLPPPFTSRLVKRVIGSTKYIFRSRHKLKTLTGKLLTIERGSLNTSTEAAPVRSALPEEEMVLTSSELELTKRPPSPIPFPAHTLFRISNAHLIGTRAAPLTARRRIITEHLYGSDFIALSKAPETHGFADLMSLSLTRPQETRDQVFSVNGPFAFNFFHWFTDLLPLVKYYEEALLSVRNDIELWVPFGRTNWQTRSLELLGYCPTGYREYNHRHLQARSLYIPSWHKPIGDDLPPPPSYVNWIRKRFSIAERTSRNARIGRLFVSRGNSRRRRIDNENEIFELLKTHNFQKVVLENMSLDEQITAFSTANCIIASHGAGLTNLLWTTEPFVVELVPPHSGLNHFMYLTKLVNGNYQRIYAQRRGTDGPCLADPGAVCRAVKALLA